MSLEELRDELEACPHCGGEPWADILEEEVDEIIMIKTLQVYHVGCCAEMDSVDPATLIERWNARVVRASPIKG